jgi:hypothetical protein
MRKIIFLLVTLGTPSLLTTSILADWHPRVYNAIKWTAPNQGSRTIEYTTNQGITYVPIAYHGGVDWNESGEITASNIKRFTDWVHQELPSDYCGPVVIDYEQPWRVELSAKTCTPERLQEILNVYGEGIRIAQSVQPISQWGYWGMPLLRNTGQSWKEQGLSMRQLTTQCTALYPDIYDASRGSEQIKRTKNHISSVLELAAGEIPVYAFVSPRFAGEDGDHSKFVPDDVFLRRVNAAMQASWSDESGMQHKIQGVILWDTYNFSPESEWVKLDQKHKYYFELLQALVHAWAEASKGTPIDTCINETHGCQFGLPEPKNSGDVLPQGSQTRITPKLEVPRIEKERVPSGRVPSHRTE